MNVANFIFRSVFAIWLCLGTQVHLAVDHAAVLHHDATAHLSHVAELDAGPTICCFHTPQHQHHDGSAPHAHLTEALLTGSAQRNLLGHQVALPPVTALELLASAAPVLPPVLATLAPEAPATHNAALRAPPLAC